jgi:Sec-independent protein translocase protein TatA
VVVVVVVVVRGTQDMRERAVTLGASLRDRAERVQQRASNHLATLTSSRAPTASTPAPPATLHAHTRSSSSSDTLHAHTRSSSSCETLHAHTRSSSSCGELPEEPPHRAESESSDEEDSPPVSPAARVVPKVSIGPLLGATPTQTPVAARAVPRLQPPPLSSQGLPASPAVGSFAPSATPPLEEEAVAVDLWSDFTAAASPAGEPGDLLATALGLGELLQPDSSASLI